MSIDARPTTPPAADAADQRPDLPRWEPGPDKLPLSIWWREHIRDMRWSTKQQQCGGFDRYVGEFVGVWEERVIVHAPDLPELRAQIARLPGIDPSRVVVTYIEPPIFFSE